MLVRVCNACRYKLLHHAAGDARQQRKVIIPIIYAEDLAGFKGGKTWVKLGDISLIINTKGEIVP